MFIFLIILYIFLNVGLFLLFFCFHIICVSICIFFLGGYTVFCSIFIGGSFGRRFIHLRLAGFVFLCRYVQIARASMKPDNIIERIPDGRH